MLPKRKSRVSTNIIIHVCEKHRGTARRNVPKFLIREFFKAVLNFPDHVLEEIKKKLVINTDEFDKVLELCNELNKNEKIRTPSTVRKDYVKFINIRIQNKLYNVAFNIVLGDTLDKFRRGDYGRIGEGQREIYKTTIEELYVASSHKILIDKEKDHVEFTQKDDDIIVEIKQEIPN